MVIHQAYAAQFENYRNQRINLRYGIQTLNLPISFSTRMPLGQLSLPHSVINNLKIPLTSYYEIRTEKNEVQIGPYIGILIDKKKGNLERKLNILNEYVSSYEKIGGSILAFSLEGVDRKTNTIEGLLYDPQQKTWEKGIYPFPAAVFKTIRWNGRWRSYFQSMLGKRVFNDYGFDKWQMYQWLHSSSELKRHLPKTVPFNDQDSLELLSEFKQLYIKPVDRSLGKGIKKVSKDGEGITLFEKRGNHTTTIRFKTLDEVQLFLRNRIKKRKYIIQEALDLLSYQGKMIDFRVITVKNSSGKWENQGIISRYGRSNHIVSNISSGGEAESGSATIKKMIDSKAEEALEIEKKMQSLALEAARCIERRGIHCGNLGIDMAIDRNKRIWIIEMNNNNPDHTIALDAGDRELYERTLENIMLYAKCLSGFRGT